MTKHSAERGFRGRRHRHSRPSILTRFVSRRTFALGHAVRHHDFHLNETYKKKSAERIGQERG